MTAPRGHGLRRDIDLLEALGSPQAQRAGGLGVQRVAELTGRDKSQVSRALRALAEAGLVERDPDTLEYQLGWRLFALVARGSPNRLVRAAEPVLRGLAAELEETCHLCVLREHEVLTLLSVSGHSFRVAEWEGRAVPAVRTSAGRVLLADADPDELYVRFGAAEPALPGLWSLIGRARRAGYAAVREEFEPGLVGVSAPVRDFRGRVVAALNVSAPAERLGARLDAAGRRTARAAAAVSVRLGWTPPATAAETVAGPAPLT